MKSEVRPLWVLLKDEAKRSKLLDYWNALPPEDFADAYFHPGLSGEKHFAELLAGDIKKLVCP